MWNRPLVWTLIVMLLAAPIFIPHNSKEYGVENEKPLSAND